MIIINRSSIQCILIGITLFSFSFKVVEAAPSFGPQSSSKNIEWDFDFVERFDGLQDWVRNEGRVGNVWSIHDSDKMPRLADGSESAWGYYSAWSSELPSQQWIGAYGDNRVWRGTKSAAIDIGGAEGPSRLGFSMGEGYNDFYLFFMTNIPKNEFPTSCAGGSCQGGALGTYTEGSEYSWFASWKFNTFNFGCPSVQCTASNNSYSEFHIITHLQKYNYGSAPGMTPHVSNYANSNDAWALDGNMNLDNYLGDWFGIEYHITVQATQVVYEMWVYDKDGNATKVMNSGVFPILPVSEQGKPLNQFFFGGNNSNTFTWGPTMQSVYFIDDVIVDGNPIGPKYFEFIKNSQPQIAPTPPTRLKILEKNDELTVAR